MNTFKNKIKNNFTAIPNSVAEDKNLTWKAKGIFLYLASKPDGWKFYMDEIKENAADGKIALQSGIKELEELNYLKRIRVYKDGKISGWDWELTLPEWDKTLQTGNLLRRKPSRKETPSYTKKDNTKKDNTKKDKTFSVSVENEKYISLAKHLSKTVQTQMNINHTKKQIESWANEIRLLSKQNKIDRKRIIKALKWYRSHAGGQFIPVIHSGAALRKKFSNLENAMKRETNPTVPFNNHSVNGYMEKGWKQQSKEIEI